MTPFTPYRWPWCGGNMTIHSFKRKTPHYCHSTIFIGLHWNGKRICLFVQVWIAPWTLIYIEWLGGNFVLVDTLDGRDAQHRMRQVKINYAYTFGIDVFSMFRIVVIVKTDVIPRATLAAVDSFGMQKLIHEIITIRAHGE